MAAAPLTVDAADGEHLARLVSLVDTGALRVADAVPLTDAQEAHARLATPGTRGRVILTT
ncbi:hypothetical protein AMK16_12170 [Streptomyces sp. CB00455]|uniref:zinc-binding dehydrogenase n=1 Tax=Streptomyces sp. CB00455 TaxID=1703927 RepID=UPI00093A4C8E|nr:zinc-binding dehydrogenase [Streptomyces sp. CB00455]OKK21111.1 hypothetical protein AMK16_12170 [Streptomyces sp. CB00455]